MNKMSFRAKAMNQMMKEKPSLEVKKKKVLLDENMDGTPEASMETEESSGEMISMMVTPEEKALIEKMRSGDSGGVDDEEDEDL